MNWIFFVACGGVLAVAVSGYSIKDITCFMNEMETCKKLLEISLDFVGIKAICGARKAVVECREDAAEECNLEDEPTIINSNRLWKELCTDGTLLNRQFFANHECMQEAGSLPECAAALNMELDKIRAESTDQAEGMRKMRLAVCRLIEDRVLCDAKKTLKMCGEDAAEAYNKFHYETVFKVDQMLCEVVLANNTVRA